MRVLLLFAAFWTPLDGLVLSLACRTATCHPHMHSNHGSIPTMAADDPEEMKVTVRIKKPSRKGASNPLASASDPPASPTTLAIEASFVEAASGMGGANYEFALMEFIRATRDAYDEGIMVPALNLELSMCQKYTAGRPLQPDEIDLRTVWLSLVYLTFERVGYESKSAGTFPGQSVAADLRQKFYTFTYDIVNAKKQGFDLAGLKLEEVLQSSEEKTPMEQAVLSQAMRICYLAIQAAEEVM
jgi:hypothetical protein